MAKQASCDQGNSPEFKSGEEAVRWLMEDWPWHWRAAIRVRRWLGRLTGWRIY